jgi:membrane-associated protease RseP (regulator of RpoE activity)
VFRLFLALNLLFLNLYACKGGYDSCKQKVLDSHTIEQCSLYIPITKHQRVVYTTNPPKEKILKYDPLLSLYLIEDTKGFPYPFRMNMQAQLGIASISEKTPIEGKILKRQIGLNSLATFSEPIFYPSIITSSCCSLEAIVTPRGIIEKEYIQRFINTKDVSYGDVGIRVKEEKGKVVVAAVNPFVKNNPFKKGDVLVSLNDKKISSAATLMRQILFAKIGSKQKFQVKRDMKTEAFSAITYKRYGGGCVSDTFLEEKGLFFNKEMQIIDLQKDFASYGLKRGDKLIGINGVTVKTQEDLQKYMAESKEFSSLLLQRDGFEFFVNID